MTTTQLISAILVGFAFAEWTDIAPWFAARMIRWAAPYSYPDDEERAATHTEKLLAVIEERPGKLLKLASALAFAMPAIRKLTTRTAAAARVRARREALMYLDELDERRHRTKTVILDGSPRTEGLQPSARLVARL